MSKAAIGMPFKTDCKLSCVKTRLPTGGTINQWKDKNGVLCLPLNPKTGQRYTDKELLSLTQSERKKCEGSSFGISVIGSAVLLGVLYYAFFRS